MLNTIFKKQLFIYLSSLTVGFLLLGIVLWQVMSGYFTSQKEAVLTEQGKKISGLYIQAALSGGYFGTISLNQINREIEILYQYLDASLLITDADFNVILPTPDAKITDEVNLHNALGSNNVDAIKSGEKVTITGKMGGIFSEQVLTVAYPIMLNEQMLGVIFLNSSLTDLQRTIGDAVRIIVICLLVTAVLSFILIYILSKRFSKPLIQMNHAARIIADGDFEKRIEIGSKDEIGQLAESFNNMAESLNRHEERRREFIANISHDLRSPLTSMRGFLQAIADGTIPPESQDYYINIVLEETIRLTKLANDLLDLNKLTDLELALDLEKFDINELIRRILPSFEQRIKEKQLETNLKLASETTYVKADYDKIERVIYNLLDNAVKFSNQEGTISLETSIDKEVVRIAISDTGCGLKKVEQKRVFERFYKADSSRGQTRGSGLGLSIVKEFIKAHNQSVTVKSEPGKGATFEFTLALEPV